ncbi:hypothetical protein MTBLM5_440020 [Magnetospirillum sp. LM-5]|nr:hypothetical protein MTBLM5_440020 [Magnetospirillum sp. LM-5]
MQVSFRVAAEQSPHRTPDKTGLAGEQPAPASPRTEEYPHETLTTPAGPLNTPLKTPLNYDFMGILMPLIHGIDWRYLDCRRGVAPLGMKGIDHDGDLPHPGGNQHLPRLH